MVVKKINKISKEKQKKKEQQKLEADQKVQQVKEHITDKMEEEEQLVLEKEEQKLQGIKQYEKIFEHNAVYSQNRIQLSDGGDKIWAIANNKLNIFSRTANRIMQTVSHDNEEIVNFRLSTHGNVLVTFTNDHWVRFITVSKEVSNEESCNTIYSLVMTREVRLQNYYLVDIQCDDQLCTMFNQFNIIKTFQLRSGNSQLNEFNNHTGVVCLRIGRQQQLLAGGEDHSIKIYDIIMNKCLRTIKTGVESQIMEIIQMNKNTVVLHEKGVVNVFDQMWNKRSINLGLECSSMVVVQQNNLPVVLAGGKDGLLQAIRFQEDGSYKVQERQDVDMHSTAISHILNNNAMFSIVSEEQNITDYQLLSDNTIQEGTSSVLFNDEVIDLKYNTSNEIVMATNSKTLKIFNRESRQFSLLHGCGDIVLCIFVRDIWLGVAGKDNHVYLFRRIDNQYRLWQIYSGHSEDVTCVTISNDCRYVYSASNDKSIKQWKIDHQISQRDSPLALRSVLGHSKDINCLSIAPNDKYLASGGQDRTLHILDNQLVSKFQQKTHKRGVYAIDFSPYEQTVVSGGGDSLIKVTNVITGEVVSTMTSSQPVVKVLFINYGLQVVSGGVDGLIKIWLVSKQMHLTTYDLHQGKVWALDITNQGQQICTGSNDSAFILLNDVTASHQALQESQHQQEVQVQFDFQNLFREGKYLKAVQLAFCQNYVQGFRQALIGLMDGQNGEGLETVVDTFITEDVNRLLIFIRDLNTNVKYCVYAQALLRALFLNRTVAQIIQVTQDFSMRNNKKDESQKEIVFQNSNNINNDFEKYLTQVISYTEKHKDRLQKYIKETYYIDFALQKINHLLPKVNENQSS